MCTNLGPAGSRFGHFRARSPHPSASSAPFLRSTASPVTTTRLRTAGLSLESVNLSDVTQSGEALEKVVRKLGSGAMPPASAPKPDKATAQAFLTSLETSLDQAAAAHPNPGRPMMMHRLNRTEYLNAVHDLFHADLSPRDASLLPPDDTSFGFDNNGDILGLSPLLLERYLSVANRVTTAALGPTSGIDAGCLHSPCRLHRASAGVDRGAIARHPWRHYLYCIDSR